MIILTESKALADQVLADLFMAQNDPAPPHDPALQATEWNWCELTASQLQPAENRLWVGLNGPAHLLRCQIHPGRSLSAWNCLVIIDQADGSQFDALRQLDPAQLPGAVACIAASGRGFHGHHSRSWETRHGNLHLSTHCDPNLDAATCGLSMTALPAVAVIDALNFEGPWESPPQIKWVNDILMAGGKVAGVLTATQSYRGRLTALTLGIGVNIAHAPVVQPTAFVPMAGCLAEQNVGIKRSTMGSVLAGCLDALWRRLESVRQRGPQDLIQAYRDHSLIIGRRVVIWPDRSGQTETRSDSTVALAEGVVLAIGSDLSLTLAGHEGAIQSGRLALPED